MEEILNESACVFTAEFLFLSIDFSLLQMLSNNHLPFFFKRKGANRQTKKIKMNMLCLTVMLWKSGTVKTYSCDYFSHLVLIC